MSRNKRRRSRSLSGSEDELATREKEEGQLDIRTGEYLKDRYKVLGLAGMGTFGTVLDVIDTKRDERMALKVVRSVKRYLEAAQVEVDILKKLKRADVKHDSLCVRLLTSFEVKHRKQRHFCLGFEKLGRSLYDFCKKNHHLGFTSDHVKCFGYQLIQAVRFCHRMKLIHTDLKPENILLMHSEYRNTYRESNRGGPKDYRTPLSADIRLIDFGGATFENEHHSRIVNTRQYRSPEVLLGLGWSFASDMWSVGCILGELMSGNLLFSTHEDLEHLALMEKILDRPLPPDMLERAIAPCRAKMEAHPEDILSAEEEEEDRRKKHKKDRRRDRSSSRPQVEHYLDWRTSRLKWPQAASSHNLKAVNKAKTLRQQFGDEQFVSLLSQLLEYNPDRRLTADQALDHPFFDSVRELYPQIECSSTAVARSNSKGSRSSARETSRSSRRTRSARRNSLSPEAKNDDGRRHSGSHQRDHSADHTRDNRSGDSRDHSSERKRDRRHRSRSHSRRRSRSPQNLQKKHDQTHRHGERARSWERSRNNSRERSRDTSLERSRDRNRR